jgi:hypothetical protein
VFFSTKLKTIEHGVFAVFRFFAAFSRALGSSPSLLLRRRFVSRASPSLPARVN